jgi:hypothetical protein
VIGAYRRISYFSATLAIVLGFAIVVRTAYRGGGTVGYVVGPLFIALGAARLYILRRT